jgi:hypothetical protein
VVVRREICQGLLGCDTMLCCCLHVQDEDRQQDPSKHWYPTEILHGIINQKSLTSVFTDVKTSNLALE